MNESILLMSSCGFKPCIHGNSIFSRVRRAEKLAFGQGALDLHETGIRC